MFFVLKKLGFHVVVCGNRENDPCHQYADKSLFLDYSLHKNTLKSLKDLKVRYLAPTCNDFSYMTGAYLAETMQLDGFDLYENAKWIHNKTKFRELTNQLSIPSPKSLIIDRKKEKFIYPIIIKPDDSFSGRGITKVNHIKDLSKAILKAKYFSRSKKFVCEQYVPGTLHSHSAFLKDQKIFTDFFVDEFCTVYPYQVNSSNSPSLISSKSKNKVRDCVFAIADKLKLVDGLFHTQFKLNKEKIWILESMRRCPGDLFPKLIELSTGFNYTENFLRPYIGLPLEKNFHFSKITPHWRHTATANKSSVFDSIKIQKRLSVNHIAPLKQSGERLQPAPFDKVAILFGKIQRKIKPQNTANYVKVKNLHKNNN